MFSLYCQEKVIRANSSFFVLITETTVRLIKIKCEKKDEFFEI